MWLGCMKLLRVKLKYRSGTTLMPIVPCVLHNTCVFHPPSLQHTLCHVSAVSANRRRGIKIFSLLFLRNEREASAVPPPPPPQKRGARAKTSVAAARLHSERLGEKRGRKRGREAPSAVARASLGRRKEREREKEGERHRERLRRWLGPAAEQAPTCATTGG